MEYIVKNDLYEEIRIEDGLILKVSKYNYLSYSRFYESDLIGKIKRVSNKLYQLKEEITREEYNKGEVTYPVGTYIIDRHPVESCDRKDYNFELTAAGGSIGGGKDKLIRKLNKVIEQIELR